MADFIYGSYAYYTAVGGNFITSGNTDGTITDFDNDNQFETTGGADFGGNDPVYGAGMEYWGTILISGTIYPVFFISSQNAYVVFAQSDNELPATGFGANFSSLPSVTPGASFSFCFAPGTLIDTTEGPRAVETLAIGDTVATADGRSVAVKWIGRQTLFPALAPSHRGLVRVTAGALGDGLPRRDLTVTADHGMILDGFVVNAGAMVNGDTIRWATDLPQKVTVYHVETEAHDVILAEGAPAETFIDYAGRAAFDNYDDYLTLYGADRIIREAPLPRISSARMLPQALRDRLGIGRGAETASRVA